MPIGKVMETEKETALKSEEMEVQNKNSSKDTVPSDSEEISVNPKLNSSLDTVSLFQERKHRHYKSKYEHRRRKSSHSRNSVPNDKNKKYCRHRKRCKQKQQSSEHRNKLETIQQTITQEIQVQKNSSKCNINLNTTECDDDRNSINEEKSQCSKNQQRPVPRCRRPLCISSRLKEGTIFHMHSKEPCKRSSTEPAIRREIKKQFDQPSSRLDPDEDHISTKSSEKYSDIPMSYKNVVKHSKKYESKLDTLIKRTKERERKLVEQSRNNNVSSPYTDISSGEFPTYSDYASSLHSRSTLILDPQPPETGDSPNIESFHPLKTEKSPNIESFHPLKYEKSPNIQSFHTIKTEKYSPTSFNKDFDSEFEIEIKSEFNNDSGTYSPIQHPMQKLFNNSDFEMKIKSEFIMDSGIYSPIQHPMQKISDNKEWLKKDIKCEPKEENITGVFN